jgi:hypothetical protein
MFERLHVTLGADIVFGGHNEQYECVHLDSDHCRCAVTVPGCGPARSGPARSDCNCADCNCAGNYRADDDHDHAGDDHDRGEPA